MNSIYISTQLSKTNHIIPLFSSNKLMHSKYNPINEAENFIKTINKSDFFIMLGIGGVFHIIELLKKFPDSKILCVENSENDILFLKQNVPLYSKIEQNNNIIITTIDKLEKSIIENFIPSIYFSFSTIEHKAWINENINQYEKIKTIIKNAIEKISIDYSVQVHFGKIWQKNILINLKNTTKNRKYSFPLNKKALIVAAGPSLDSKIDFIKENQKDFYIIATDTAYSSLYKNNINCDCVVSIDGQNISHSHFIKKHNKKTLFVLDYCGNSSILNKLSKDDYKYLFISNGHPFIPYCQNIQNKNIFIKTSSYAGTVTISAIDFALKVGFTDFLIIGADFSYTNNKPYAKGTYLDDLYFNLQTKINTAETSYNKLMFRTELIKKENTKTTKILTSYKEGLENWLKDNKIEFYLENYIYNCKINNSFNSKDTIEQDSFNFYNLKKSINNLNDESIKTALLPYISYLKNKHNEYNFEDLLKLAINDIVEYTNKL